jgi:hypothetical protein
MFSDFPFLTFIGASSFDLGLFVTLQSQSTFLLTGENKAQNKHQNVPIDPQKDPVIFCFYGELCMLTADGRE